MTVPPTTTPTTVKCQGKRCNRDVSRPYTVSAEGAGDSGPFGEGCARKIVRAFQDQGIDAHKQRAV